jgi:hypothetical protein
MQKSGFPDNGKCFVILYKILTYSALNVLGIRLDLNPFFCVPESRFLVFLPRLDTALIPLILR